MEYTYSEEGTDFTIHFDEVEDNHFIQFINPEGEIFREVIHGYEVVLPEKRIEGRYLFQEITVAGRVSASELKSFAATSQENWGYFKGLTRTAERDIKMLFNGLSLDKRNKLLFAADGNFIADATA